MADGGSARRAPNVLITGTPGTGKTSLAEAAAARLGMRHINVTELVRERELHAGRDESFDTYVLDEASEDRLLDMMEDMVAEGGCIVDFHSSELFPIRWFDLVLVLRCNNTVLYDRLLGRGYSEKKITENVTAEIMGVAEEEARESYPEEAVHTLASETVEQADANLERLVVWHGTWLEEHSAGAGHA